MNSCSSNAITFHNVNDHEMFVMEYLIYNLQPYGIINLPQKIPMKYSFEEVQAINRFTVSATAKTTSPEAVKLAKLTSNAEIVRTTASTTIMAVEEHKNEKITATIVLQSKLQNALIPGKNVSEITITATAPIVIEKIRKTENDTTVAVVASPSTQPVRSQTTLQSTLAVISTAKMSSQHQVDPVISNQTVTAPSLFRVNNKLLAKEMILKQAVSKSEVDASTKTV
jgi:hypothetical protein